MSDVERVRRAFLAELAEWTATIGEPVERADTLAVVREQVEQTVGVPCVAQFALNGDAIVVTPALRQQ